MNIKKGDFVKGKPNNIYGITNENMTKAVVTNVLSDSIIKIKILEHIKGDAGVFDVNAQYFEVIGRQKEFNRNDVLKLLKNSCKKAVLDYDLSGADLRRANLSGADLSDANLRRANLSGADLSDANLRRADLSDADLRRADLRRADLRRADLRRADLSDADLDFSCWPLWCGSLKVKTDIRLAYQLAYHLCSMQCKDEEYIKMRNSILDFANQFHRANEYGKLEKINLTESRENVNVNK